MRMTSCFDHVFQYRWSVGQLAVQYTAGQKMVALEGLRPRAITIKHDYSLILFKLFRLKVTVPPGVMRRFCENSHKMKWFLFV